LPVLWLQVPRLVDEFQVEEDFRTFYWMNKFQDPALFPDDRFRGNAYTHLHLAGRDLILTFYSIGYGLLFYAASFFITPVTFSKILAFFVVPITAWYLLKFGQSVRNRNTGLALAAVFTLLNLASPTSISIIPGLQRSLACSLIIPLIYYLHHQKYKAAAITIWLSALFYPPMFALGVIIWGLFAFKISWRPPQRWSISMPGFGALGVACVLSVLLMSPMLMPRFTHALTGQQPAPVAEQAVTTRPDSYKYLWDNPTFRQGGQTPLFFLFPFVGRGGLVEDSEDAANLLILFIMSCLIYLVRGRTAFALPRVIWCVFWAGLLMFTLAWANIWLTSSFLLYLPSRYSRVGLFLFLLFFVVLNGENTVKEALASIRRNPQRLAWLVGGAEVMVLGLLFLYPSDYAKISGFNMKWLLAPAGLLFAVLGIVLIKNPPQVSSDTNLSQTSTGRAFLGVIVVACLLGWGIYAPVVSKVSFLNPPQAERDMLAFLATLPKDALIAGTPCILDSVPLLAKRQILFSCEQVSQDTQLIHEALNVYYADNTQVVVDFCQAHAIDYLAVDLQTYTEEYLANGRIFFEPYNHELLPRIAGRDTFALAHVPDQLKIFQSQNLFVVPCLELASINNE
jgi:hypothetical protein